MPAVRRETLPHRGCGGMENLSDRTAPFLCLSSTGRRRGVAKKVLVQLPHARDVGLLAQRVDRNVRPTPMITEALLPDRSPIPIDLHAPALHDRAASSVKDGARFGRRSIGVVPVEGRADLPQGWVEFFLRLSGDLRGVLMTEIGALEFCRKPLPVAKTGRTVRLKSVEKP